MCTPLYFQRELHISFPSLPSPNTSTQVCIRSSYNKNSSNSCSLSLIPLLLRCAGRSQGTERSPAGWASPNLLFLLYLTSRAAPVVREEEGRAVCVQWVRCWAPGLVWAAARPPAPLPLQHGPWVGLAHHSSFTAKGQPVKELCGFTPVACLTFGPGPLPTRRVYVQDTHVSADAASHADFYSELLSSCFLIHDDFPSSQAISFRKFKFEFGYG